MKNFEEQLKRGREIKMSPDEKGMIRFALIQKVSAAKKKAESPTPVFSPYVRNLKVVMSAVRSPFHFPHALKALAVILIVGIGGGTTLSYASEKTLPGDTLYTFKVNVSEPIRGVLAVTSEEKANHHAQLIVNRVEEAKELKETGNLTPEKTEIVKNLIEKESETFVAAAVELQAEGKDEEVAETTSVILASLTDYENTVAPEVAAEEPVAPEVTEEATPTEDTALTEETTLMKAADAPLSTMSLPALLETTPEVPATTETLPAEEPVKAATDAEVSAASEIILDSTFLNLKATLEETIANPAPEVKGVETEVEDPIGFEESVPVTATTTETILVPETPTTLPTKETSDMLLDQKTPLPQNTLFKFKR